MKVHQSRQFAKAVKKLHVNEKSDLDKIVQLLMQDPLIGDRTDLSSAHQNTICQIELELRLKRRTYQPST